MFERERLEALACVRAAARLCRKVKEQTRPETLEKGDRSPVTVADFGSQALICRHLGSQFPGDPIVAEENADALRELEQRAVLEKVTRHVMGEIGSAVEPQSVLEWIDHGSDRAGGERFWTLDPIDGTKGFLRGDQYAVVLALIVDGHPVVGAMACPNYGPSGALVWAVKGEGAAWCPLDAPHDAVGERLQVSREHEAPKSRFCESFESGHSSHSDSALIADRLGIAGNPVRMDSQAKYFAVAKGDAEIYMRMPTRPGYVEKIWDHAAGALVVEEAGGQVTDVSGQRLDFGQGHQLERNRGVVVTNGPLHDALIGAMKEERIVERMP